MRRFRMGERRAATGAVAQSSGWNEPMRGSGRALLVAMRKGGYRSICSPSKARAGAPSDIDRSVGLFTLCEIYLEAAHKIELSIGCRVISRRAYE